MIDTVQAKHLLCDLSDRRGKIARMLETGELVSLRRGLYASRRDINPISVAGPIYGPSYVSFQTALSWYGLIPEAVRETISATFKRPALFENALGRFRYLKVPPSAYPVGITRVADEELPFLLASPTKALCDTIALQAGFRSMTDVGRWLEEMRIASDLALSPSELQACALHYGRPAVRWLQKFAQKHRLINS